MANSTSTLLDAGLVKEMATPGIGQKKRRRIDPKTGQALVILGHAIEYLADEFVYSARGDRADLGQLEAIQLLMAKNRDIYLACPEAPTLAQTLRAAVQALLGLPSGPHKLGSGLGQRHI